MKVNLDSWVRENIKRLKPYSSARNEYSGSGVIYLDANENPYNNPYNRYPDPMHNRLRDALSEMKGVDKNQVFLGNGSDEGIDLLIRIFCEPKSDNIVSMEPTYGMYKVCADINDVEYRAVKLTSGFQLDLIGFGKAIDPKTKLVFLCSPNNPTGNTLNSENIKKLLEKFPGPVVLDEAYIDFSNQQSFLNELDTYPNLVVLQTFSKAWGLAGIRFGMVYAQKEIVELLYKVKYPYNLNTVTQDLAFEFMSKKKEKDNWVEMILKEKQRLESKIEKLPMVEKNYPTNANFLMVKITEPLAVLEYLKEKKIIVRDRSRVSLCEGCLRITVGSSKENDALLNALNEWKA